MESSLIGQIAILMTSGVSAFFRIHPLTGIPLDFTTLCIVVALSQIIHAFYHHSVPDYIHPGVTRRV
jgi:hypothetical protein